MGVVLNLPKGTLCSWCSAELDKVAFNYLGEMICPKCKKEKERDGESNMERWQYELDKWLTTPPEDEEDCEDEEEIVECDCGEIVRKGENYYKFGDEIYCECCLKDYISEHKYTVGE